MRLRHLWILVMLLSLHSVIPPAGYGASRKMTAGQFPVSVGSRWVYAVHDSVANRADTVHVAIVHATDFPGGRWASVWQYRSRSSIDTQYVVRAGDTISFYRSRSPQSITAVFIFPILPGRNWTVVPPGTMNVQRILTVAVPAGKFRHSFEVKSRPAVRNFIGGTTYALAPHIGIVRMHNSSVDTINDQRENILWQLLSFKIAR
jgi:hypothetical protein